MSAQMTATHEANGPMLREQRGVEGQVAGRRVYPRFRQGAPPGLIRISRDVDVQPEATDSQEMFVISDAAAVIGEVVTLALVSSNGERELRVQIVDSRPHVVDGVMRHRVRLKILSARGLSG